MESRQRQLSLGILSILSKSYKFNVVGGRLTVSSILNLFLYRVLSVLLKSNIQNFLL